MKHVMSILKWFESKEKVVGWRVRKEDALFVVGFLCFVF